jgi:hypothetical protein
MAGVVTAVVELANSGGHNTKINWKDTPPVFHDSSAKFPCVIDTFPARS